MLRTYHKTSIRFLTRTPRCALAIAARKLILGLYSVCQKPDCAYVSITASLLRDFFFLFSSVAMFVCFFLGEIPHFCSPFDILLRS